MVVRLSIPAVPLSFQVNLLVGTSDRVVWDRRMVLLLQMHAKTCHAQNCPVPRCREIKLMRNRQAQRSEDMRRVAYLNHIRGGGMHPGSVMVPQQQHRQGY